VKQRGDTASYAARRTLDRRYDCRCLGGRHLRSFAVGLAHIQNMTDLEDDLWSFRKKRHADRPPVA
jgi:hypothetical protein